MMKSNVRLALMLAPLSAILPGCAPKITMEDLKAMTPQRPPELAMLKQFEGNWEGTSEMRITGLDEVLKGKGSSKMSWAADGWYMIENAQYDMGELGTMHGIGIWGYNPNTKKFDMHWFDSHGMHHTGSSTYDASTKTWRMSGGSSGPWGNTVGEGTMTFTDDNTMEWTYQEWDSWKLNKFAEMKGTAKRK